MVLAIFVIIHLRFKEFYYCLLTLHYCSSSNVLLCLLPWLVAQILYKAFKQKVILSLFWSNIVRCSAEQVCKFLASHKASFWPSDTLQPASLKLVSQLSRRGHNIIQSPTGSQQNVTSASHICFSSSERSMFHHPTDHQTPSNTCQSSVMKLPIAALGKDTLGVSGSCLLRPLISPGSLSSLYWGKSSGNNVPWLYYFSSQQKCHHSGKI